MADQAHQLAPHHLPPFLPSADGSDWLMTVMIGVLIVGAVLAGVFYLHLHSIPERLAHKHGRVHFELVAVLGLLALLTHNNIFWVAALILAFIQFPDFRTPIESIAHSLNRLSGKGDSSSGAPESNGGNVENREESAVSQPETLAASPHAGKAQKETAKSPPEQSGQELNKEEPQHV
ncbi:hypothetical protein [Roseibium sp. M-1]